ncbi:hypothetical protein ACFFIF_10785 [Vagococcus entomophilus]|uniref:hypothetical protein n=1 Tax=Vagococcus entomophilus TaxID=1160095 RepID=UPI001B877902
MDKRAEHSKKESIEVERQSVNALKNTFENIKEVKVEKSVYDKITGSYGMFVTMKNNKNQSVYFTYTFWKKTGENDGIGIEDREIQKKGITQAKITVIFSNGDEEII